MIKNFSNEKCSSGIFALTENTVLEIVIPDDALGVKILSDVEVRGNIDSAPETPVDDTLSKGAIFFEDVLENRILSLGINRKLYLLAATAGTVKIEFWG